MLTDPLGHWAKKAGSGPSSQQGQDVQRHWDREDLRRVGTAVCKRAWLDHRCQGGGFTDVKGPSLTSGPSDAAADQLHGGTGLPAGAVPEGPGSSC